MLLAPGSTALIVGFPGIVTGEELTEAEGKEFPAGLVATAVIV
jgi:hypothetical protein